MNTNELLRDEAQYRLLLAMHSILRMIGFSADDIYVAIGKNAATILKREGLEFVVTFGDLARPYDQFCAEWRYISEHSHEIDNEIMERAKQDWRALLAIPQLLMAITAKGITLPRIGRNEQRDLN